MSYYSGYASQRGRGLGNIMGGIVRAAVPWIGHTLKKAAVAAGKSILKDGIKSYKRGPQRQRPVSSRPNVKRTTSRKRKRPSGPSPRSIKRRHTGDSLSDNEDDK